MDDIYRTGRAKAGHGSFALLYWVENELKPTVLIWVTPEVCFTRHG